MHKESKHVHQFTNRFLVTPNTGGGGGAGFLGLGGSGVIILKIPDPFKAAFTSGVTFTEDTSSVPGFRIYAVTATSSSVEKVTFTT